MSSARTTSTDISKDAMITSLEDVWTQTFKERKAKKDPSVVAPDLMRYLDSVRWPGTVQPLPKSLADAVQRKTRSNAIIATLASFVNAKPKDLRDHVDVRSWLLATHTNMLYISSLIGFRVFLP